MYQVELSFSNTSSVDCDDVEGCQIKKISARAFQNIVELQRLHLHNNKLEEIRQKTVGSMEGLHSLSLHGNPWRCDCHLTHLINWLMVANLPMVDLPRCRSPPRLTGQRFADVTLDNFACSPELLSTPRYLEANVGEQNISIKAFINSNWKLFSNVLTVERLSMRKCFICFKVFKKS